MSGGLKIVEGDYMNPDDLQRIRDFVNKKYGKMPPTTAEALTYGAETGGSDDTLNQQIKQIFDAVVKKRGIKVARDKITTKNVLKAFGLTQDREKDIRIAIANAKKQYGGKTKLIIPENEIKMAYDAWKEQAFTKKRGKEDYMKAIRDLGYPKSVENQLLKTLDIMNATPETLIDIIKQWDIKKKNEEKQQYHPRPHRKTYRPNKRKYKGRRLGGKSGENFREDYKRYLESLEMGDIDPDDKVKIREKKAEIKDKVEDAVEDAKDAIVEGKMNWNEFKKKYPMKENKAEYEEYKKTHPKTTNYYSYLAFRYRQYTGKLIEGDEGYKGKGSIQTIKYNEPEAIDVPINIDGRRIPWSSSPRRYMTAKGGIETNYPRITKRNYDDWAITHKPLNPQLTKGNLSNIHKIVGGAKNAWTQFVSDNPKEAGETKAGYFKRLKEEYAATTGEAKKRKKYTKKLPVKGEQQTESETEPETEHEQEPITTPKGKKGSKVKTVHSVTTITEKGGKGKVPKQLQAWHAFLKKHPWDKKEDRKCYLKRMGQLYKK